jgi:Flp pilus assembly protein TadG
MDKRKVQDKEKGQSLVELALILPLLLILLAGVVDVARLYYIYVVLTDAASEGVAYAAINPPADPVDPVDPDTSEIYARTLSACTGVGDGVQSVAIDCPTCPDVASGDAITVTVSYRYAVMTPFLNVMFDEGMIELEAKATEAVITGELASSEPGEGEE